MVAISVSVNAQKFGLKGGVNLSKIKINSQGVSEFADNKISFYVGGLLDFKINDKLHVQPEVLLSSEGSKGFDVKFVNIPLMFKYYITKGLNIQAGPQVGFVTEARITEVLIKKDALKTVSLGLNTGLGYKLNERFFFELRYNHG